MGWVLRIFLFLIVIGALGIVGFAYLGDLSPERDSVSEPVDFDDG